MKINEKSLAQYANSKQVPDMEGWLFKRGEVNKAYQKRWCTLRGNLLFYSEKKKDRDPLGVIILEGCTVELAEEETEHFAFKLVFHGDGRTGRMYVLGTSSQLELEKWMKMLACASFDFIRLMVSDLKHKIRELDTQQMVVRGDDIDMSRTRHNPFNASSSARKQTKSWMDMHAQIGKQIKEDREQWLRIQAPAQDLLAPKQDLLAPRQDILAPQEVQAPQKVFQEAGGGDEVEMTGDKLLVVL